jgi:hypothetical protein
LKIKINNAKLVDSPSSIENDSFDDIQIKELKLMLVSELIHANPSTFLISGYRGVGKTSFVMQLCNSLPNYFIPVYLNLSKYNGYSVLLKKVIRQIYISYREKVEVRRIEDQGMLSELELLYDRTFKEVSFYGDNSTKKNFEITSKTSIAFKNLIPILIFLGATLNTLLQIVDSTKINVLLMIGSFLWIFLENLIYTISWFTSKTKISGKNWKSLYDDEIAEYHVFNTLKRLNETNIKVVVCFDEIDKIREKVEIDKIISELKPMFLSGHANFFVIAGQSLVYELEKSKHLDDQIISSLFSKNIHIPFFGISTLRSFCLGLISQDTDKTDEKIKMLFDSLILKSGYIPRRLINLIRHKLRWEEDTAFIEIGDEDQDQLQLDAKLLIIIEKIVENDLDALTSDRVELDFYAAQIYIWIFKILSFKPNGLSFKTSLVLDMDSYDSEYYPQNFVSKLGGVMELLTDRLLEEGLLKILHSEDENTESSFVWNTVERQNDTNNLTSTTATEESSDMENNKGISVSEEHKNTPFLKELVETENLVKRFVIETTTESDAKEVKLADGISILVQSKVLNKSWADPTKIERILNLGNDLTHDIDNDKVEKSIPEVTFLLRRLKNELVNDFISFLLGQELPSLDVTVFLDEAKRIDFLAKDINSGIIIGAEIKYFKSGILKTNDFTKIRKDFELLSTREERRIFGGVIIVSNQKYKTLTSKSLEMQNDIFFKMGDSTLSLMHVPISLNDNTTIKDQLKVFVSAAKELIEKERKLLIKSNNKSVDKRIDEGGKNSNDIQLFSSENDKEILVIFKSDVFSSYFITQIDNVFKRNNITKYSTNKQYNGARLFSFKDVGQFNYIKLINDLKGISEVSNVFEVKNALDQIHKGFNLKQILILLKGGSVESSINQQLILLLDNSNVKKYSKEEQVNRAILLSLEKEDIENLNLLVTQIASFYETETVFHVIS